MDRILWHIPKSTEAKKGNSNIEFDISDHFSNVGDHLQRQLWQKS